MSISISQSQTFNDGVLEYKVIDVVNSYVSVKKYNNVCPTGVLTIPSTVTNSSTTYTVTSIINSAFDNCTGLTSVIIPSSVVSIGNFAFVSLGLMGVTIPLSVTNIGNSAFQNCSALMSVIIPLSVTNIGDNAFRGCTGLTSV